MDMNDESPDYRQGKYTINYDKLIHDIFTYNSNEDRFHRFVNQMCLDIEAIDELVRWMPVYAEADFVINCIKGKLNEQ